MASPFPPEEPPELAPGRAVELRGRGTTFVRELPGPPGAPVLILLHAWVATGGINWFTAYPLLGRRFRVLALDLRGHGRGLRAPGRFRLVDCADDVAALAAALEVPRALVAGYSMGGPIAQLLWRRHRALVGGLVFAATAYRFVRGATLRLLVTSGAGAFGQATRFAELARRLAWGGAPLALPTPVPSTGSVGRWAAEEMRRHEPRALLESLLEIGSYDASDWIEEIDVPTGIVLTTRDRAVDPLAQLRLARAIPGASVHPVAAGHAACAHPLFAEVFAEACDEVADRAAAEV
jgi:pimeloyl-ACP methyl ester carboxylesterase